jgi:phospholipid transport system substrate-binding protein
MGRSIRSLAAMGLTVAMMGFAAPRSAWAGDSAQDLIQTRQAQVTSLLQKAATPERDKQVSAVLESMMNYDELAKQSLAAHWSELNETQQKEFTDVLRRLVQRNYEKNVKSIADYRVEFVGEEVTPEGTVVHTRASSSSKQHEEPVTIDYRMKQLGAAWKVIDIVTDGSSLVSNYRSQFHRVIQKDGYGALVKKMKDKLAKGQTA